MKTLTRDNFLLYAAKHYQNPHCTSITDFEKDCKRFVTARTLMRNFYKRGRLPIRLLLNHVVICSNMFGHYASTSLFYYYCEEELRPAFTAIFEYLNILPTEMEHIKPDPNIQHILRNQSCPLLLTFFLHINLSSNFLPLGRNGRLMN